MKKNYNFIALLIGMCFLFAANVFAQGQQDRLSCLESVYQSKSGKVLLDCRPDDAKGIKGEVSWMVVTLDNKGMPREIIEKAIVKEGRRFYFEPKVVYDKCSDKDVMVVFTISNGTGGYSYRHKLKVKL